MMNKDFEVKQILPVAVAVAATFVLTFVAGEVRAAGCADADKVSLPSCLITKRDSRWAILGVTNKCSSTKEVHIAIIKGDDVSMTVEGNRYKQYSVSKHSFDWDYVRIGDPTLCCVTTHNCDDD